MEKQYISKGIEIFGHYKGEKDLKNHEISIYQFKNPFLITKKINNKYMEVVQAEDSYFVKKLNIHNIIKQCLNDEKYNIVQSVDENISNDLNDMTTILNKKRKVTYSKNGLGHYNIGKRNIILIPDFALEYHKFKKDQFIYRLGIKAIHLRYFSTPEDKRLPFEERFYYDRGEIIFRKFKVTEKKENLDQKITEFEYGKEKNHFNSYYEC